MSLNAIPTHPRADSYITLSEANDYFTSFYYGDTTWSGASDANKEAALKMATKLIDRLRFFSDKYSRRQNLAFPRNDEVCQRSASATGGSSNTLIDTNIASLSGVQDDDFNNYCLVINPSGTTPEFYIISDFVKSTGVITISGTFTTTPASGTSYAIYPKVADKVRFATCEIAKWLLDGKNNSGRAKLQAEGVKSFSVGDLSETFNAPRADVALPQAAYEYLKSFISKIGWLQ